MKKIAVSGYFDPIHVGHLEYLKMAKGLGDILIVIVNNDHQREPQSDIHNTDRARKGTFLQLIV